MSDVEFMIRDLLSEHFHVSCIDLGHVDAALAEVSKIVCARAEQAATAERERWRWPVAELLSLLNEVSSYGFSHDDHPGPDWDIFGQRHDELERVLERLIEGGAS